MKLGEISLLTANVPRLAAFYRKALGLTGECADEVHQFIFAEETQLSIYNDGQPHAHGDPTFALAFTVDDVYAECERLTSLGTKIEDMPKTQPWGATNMRVLDPDGNSFFLGVCKWNYLTRLKSGLAIAVNSNPRPCRARIWSRYSARVFPRRPAAISRRRA